MVPAAVMTAVVVWRLIRFCDRVAQRSTRIAYEREAMMWMSRLKALGIVKKDGQ